jgi:hypothetical protein
MGKAVRGSQAALQWMVEATPESLQPARLPPLHWVSPLRSEEYAEFRDGAALRKLGLGEHARALTEFWPRRGPVWDGLALAGDAVVLVEAKAHVTEFLTSPSAATAPESVAQIARALRQVKADLGADDRSDWSRVFFQYANRLAFLWWLRARGIDAHCLFVSFLGDTEMGGPEHAETWEALFRAADHALGLSPRHPLRPYILHVHPDLRELEKP